MHWNTYLVRLNPDVNSMDAWQERLYRRDAINGTVGMGLDRETEAELWQTVSELDTLLKHWKENSEDGQDTASLLRFYPAGSSKTARFNRYAI